MFSYSRAVIQFFGTINKTSAPPDEVTFSSTFQTAISNFIRDPSTPPAKNWAKYIPTNSSMTLAKIAYDGNVEPDNFVQAVGSESLVSINKIAAVFY